MKDFFRKLGEFILKTLKILLKFIAGRIFVSLIVGILSYAFFAILKLKYSIIMGSIIGVLNIIPTFGAIIGIILGAIYALVQEPIYAIYTLIALFIFQQLDGFLLSPLILGKSLNLKPLIIFVVVILGGMLFGLPGILLAVPVAAILKLGYQIFGKKKKDDTSNNEEK